MLQSIKFRSQSGWTLQARVIRAQTFASDSRQY